MEAKFTTRVKLHPRGPTNVVKNKPQFFKRGLGRNFATYATICVYLAFPKTLKPV
jgi:hypothetical protein